MAVTTPLRNPTIPVAGVATRAVAVAGAVAAATEGVVSGLLELLTVNACAVGTALDLVVVADGCATVVTTFTAPVEVVGDDGAVALAVECVEFDPVLAEVDVVCSGAGVAGGVLG
jgi:hypothetical protein